MKWKRARGVPFGKSDKKGSKSNGADGYYCDGQNNEDQDDYDDEFSEDEEDEDDDNECNETMEHNNNYLNDEKYKQEIK